MTGTNNRIYGDAGNDSIAVFKDANKNTLSGGTGDDKIILLEGSKNALIEYAEGDGNDTIYYFGEDNALKISGSYKISTNDSDIKIKVGNGSMLLVGAAGKNIKINGKTITNSDADDNTLPAETITPPNVPTMPETVQAPFIHGTDGNDSIIIYSWKSEYLISSGAGNDSIENKASLVTIDGGTGNDSIFNGGSSVTIDGGAGVDSIFNGASHVTINGGDGDDYIENEWGSDAKINGGDGDDYIENEWGSHVTINGGDGDDTIVHSDNMDASTFVTINAGDTLEGKVEFENFGLNSDGYPFVDISQTILRYYVEDKKDECHQWILSGNAFCL